MTQFDESKHNRHSDGKFANKPHSEADEATIAAIAAILGPEEPDETMSLALIHSQGLRLETEDDGTYLTDWNNGTRIPGTYTTDEQGRTVFQGGTPDHPNLIDVRGELGDEETTARLTREQFNKATQQLEGDPAIQIPKPTIPDSLKAAGFNFDYATDEHLKAILEADEERLWEEADEKGIEDFTIHDFDPETRAKLVRDFAQFLTDNAQDIETILTEHDADTSQIAYDFWLDRGGYGVGFSDRGYGEVGDRLAEAANEWYTGAAAVLGDDGKVLVE